MKSDLVRLSTQVTKRQSDFISELRRALGLPTKSEAHRRVLDAGVEALRGDLKNDPEDWTAQRGRGRKRRFELDIGGAK